ncbi:MAG: PilZ domain-containing protein [Spirochaetales bacterium]|nr:PilZ domain-containing protein [Spirochaetales bacterium]
MQDLSAYQITSYYERYKEVDITFNKKVMEFMQVIPKEIYLKCKDYIYPCIINSSSMIGARIIAQVDMLFFNRVKTNNNIVHLRFAFQKGDSTGQISFYVLSKMEQYTPFESNKPDLYFIDLKYNQHPPNDLVIILGTLIEAGSMIKKRKDERIAITPESLRMLRIKGSQAIFIIEDTQQKCLLRDISLSGAKVITARGKEEYLGKSVTLVLYSVENYLLGKMPGIVKRCEEIKGHEGFLALAIQYDEKNIPPEYSKRIIDYMSKRSFIDSEEKK